VNAQWVEVALRILERGTKGFVYVAAASSVLLLIPNPLVVWFGAESVLTALRPYTLLALAISVALLLVDAVPTLVRRVREYFSVTERFRRLTPDEQALLLAVAEHERQSFSLPSGNSIIEMLVSRRILAVVTSGKYARGERHLPASTYKMADEWWKELVRKSITYKRVSGTTTRRIDDFYMVLATWEQCRFERQEKVAN
jgi:hypothetical protein